MQLTYKVQVPKPLHRYDADTLFSLWGSCFSSELEHYLDSRLYRVLPSPYGVMYNPASMAQGLERLLSGRIFTEADLLQHDGQWHSSMHHGSFSTPDVAQTLDAINSTFCKAAETLSNVSLWVFTFGTSYLYTDVVTGMVVNNCHRRPATSFVRHRLEPAEIVSMWLPLLEQLTAHGAQVLMTVSPIPHYRDGAHESRLSKAVLHLAIDELQRSCDALSYFPSYEIMTDELRDYRFYQSDLCHPTPLAVEYIMERFAESYLAPLTPAQEWWRSLSQQLAHKPLTKSTPHLRNHYQRLYDALLELSASITHPLLTSSLDQVHTHLSRYL